MTGGDHGFGYHELERAAMAFVLEDESWPVFLEWIRVEHVTPESHAWLENGPDVEQVRNEWCHHSPDPYIRGASGGRDLDEWGEMGTTSGPEVRLQHRLEAGDGMDSNSPGHSSDRRTNEPSGLEVEPSTAGASGAGDHGKCEECGSYDLSHPGNPLCDSCWGFDQEERNDDDIISAH